MKAPGNLSEENKKLKARLAEVEELLAAIRSGAVDALVTDDQRVFTLESADYAYRVFVETINEGAATLAFDGTVMYCNNRLAKMCGLAIRKMVGGSIFDFILPEDLPRFKSLLRQTRKGTVRAEFQLQRSNKTFIPVLLSSNSLKLDNPGLCLVITDLTEQKKVQLELLKYRNHLEELVAERTNRLHESEQRYRGLFESSKDGILVLDFDTGMIIDVNPFLAVMVGYSRRELLKKHIWDIGLLKNVIPSKASFLKLRETQYVRYEDMPLQMKDGKTKDVEFTGNVYLLDHKKVIQCNIRDITVRKHAEEILKHDKDVFERLVQERTKVLVETQIELERAKRLSDIGTLAATVAHELRNPLATIQIAAHNIRKKMSGAPLEQHVANIEAVIEESDQIINNLLFYSRIRMPQRKVANLHGILTECISVAEQRFKKQHISLIREIGTIKELSCEVDPLQMKEVFSNILNNAYEAIADRNGTIKTRTELCDDAFLKISFRDTGEGMNPADLEKSREPFFTTKSRGTGLGLTVCSQILHLHEGTIEIESEKGKGTTVTIVLPIRKKDAKKNPDR